MLSQLSPQQVRATELAGEKITRLLTTAPGNDAPIGGLKVVAPSGWFAARPSGTEDVYKLYAESFKGRDHLRQIQNGSDGRDPAARWKRRRRTERRRAMALDSAVWPSLPLAEWQDTRDTLHMWTQIVGKTRLALAPRENHWWHVPLYVSARGLSTTPIPYRSGAFEVEFDFIDHRLGVKTSDGAVRAIALRPQAVADFYREYMDVLDSLGIAVKLWPVPVEVDAPIPFLEDRRHASYEAEHAQRFFRMLLHATRVLARFKGRFLGKSSPAHFFWGAFDLALTRFSGRRAPEAKPTEWWVLREAMSHEEISFGFWPGSGTVAEPAFYAYVRPEPPEFGATVVRPAAAYYSLELADFILPYEAVRTASRPDEAVLEFYQSVYDAGADRARWDRAALDRPPAEWP